MEQQLGRAAAARAWAGVDDLIVKALLAVEPTISKATIEQLPAAARTLRHEPSPHPPQTITHSRWHQPRSPR